MNTNEQSDSSELKDRVFVYLVDLLIVSRNFQEHIDRLMIVGTLTHACLTINVEGYEFGYIIGEGKSDSNKIETIINIKPPKTQKDIRTFLGTGGWYARFIHDFSTLTTSLTDTSKNRKVCYYSTGD